MVSARYGRTVMATYQAVSLCRSGTCSTSADQALPLQKKLRTCSTLMAAPRVGLVSVKPRLSSTCASNCASITPTTSSQSRGPGR